MDTEENADTTCNMGLYSFYFFLYSTTDIYYST